jgi:hypothetical protein
MRDDMRLARRRHGTLEISLTSLLESLVVAVLIIILLVFGYKLYQVFFGANTEAVNTYHLMADNINSLIKSPDAEKQLRFRFTFPLSSTGASTDVTNRKKFEGTVFGIDDGPRVTLPFPPSNLSSPQAFPALPSGDLEKIRKDECSGKPCLCFSKQTLIGDEGPDVLTNVLKSPYECRAFDVPAGKKLVFDFTPKAIILDKGEYPEVLIQKLTNGGTITIELRFHNFNVNTN